MIKGYIRGWKEKQDPDLETHKFGREMDVFFDHRPNEAAWWKTREDAERDKHIFENWRIAIPSSEGGVYICKNFEVEEAGPSRFVIYCIAPFLPPKPEGYR